MRFHLKEVGGRLCLPAEEFLDQAMECGFRIIVTGGLRGDLLLTGERGGGGVSGDPASPCQEISGSGQIMRFFEEKILRTLPELL